MEKATQKFWIEEGLLRLATIKNIFSIILKLESLIKVAIKPQSDVGRLIFILNRKLYKTPYIRFAKKGKHFSFSAAFPLED